MKNFPRNAVIVLLLLLVTGGTFFYLRPLTVYDQLPRMQLWLQGVHSRYVHAGQYRIHYFEALPPADLPDRPLVLVHGLGSKAEDWGPLIAPLAKQGFHVYVLDLLGYGRSDRPLNASYSIAEETAVLEQWMDTLHLGQVDMMGWSMGGWIALKFTLDHPERVRRIAVYDSAGIYFPMPFRIDLFHPSSPAALQELVNVLEPNPVRLPDFVARDYIRRKQQDGWVVDRGMAAMTSGHDLLDFRLAALKQPLLIVWGSVDRLTPPTVGETMHRMVPQSVLETVSGCGHLSPRECSGRILPPTVEFFNANPPLRAGEKSF